MLEVGKDSYVTLEEAESYIAKFYRSNNPGRQRWTLLEEPDKAALLREALIALEALPYLGRRAAAGQELAFPRLPYQYGNAEGAPEAVKRAQAELALWFSDDEAQEEQASRSDLQKQGVTSFSLGDLSETYGAGSSATVGELKALGCEKAALLLAPYLSGGYAAL